ncbi:TetR/AcrR family transcriptional regulator [Rhodobacteraceae bacterium CCMM004]|nr:TetR/AcrR family transcriptional regulator [Rhodobacteraceae bacterium CCMM004]
MGRKGHTAKHGGHRDTHHLTGHRDPLPGIDSLQWKDGAPHRKGQDEFDYGKITEELGDMTETSAPRARYHHGNLRVALLEAAEAELVDKGLEAFSLRSVAARAGVTHTAPKPHFGNTEGLLTALCALGFRRLVEVQDHAKAAAAADPVAQLEAAGLGYIAFATSNQALFRLMFASNRPNFSDQDLSQAARRAFAALETDVAQARRSKGCDQDDDALAVASAWATAHGLADLLSSGRLRALSTMESNRRDEMAARVLSNSALSV